jgi:hypothetical protein
MTDDRAALKRWVQEHAFHYHPDEGESRLIVHSLLGGLGADWDLVDVLDVIDDAASTGFVDHIMAHHLRVDTVTEGGDDGAGRKRTYYFEVPAMPAIPAPVEPDQQAAHLRPHPGDTVVVTIEGTVSSYPESYLGVLPGTTIGDVRRGAAANLNLTSRNIRDVTVLATSPLGEGDRQCMNHPDYPRPAIGGLAICGDCKTALVVRGRRPVRDEPQA